MEIASPEVNKRSGPSVVWIIPLLTLLVGSWLVFKTLSEQGPQATVSFKTAEGIEVGKTKVKYKSVDIGVVEQVQFSEDFTHVVLRVQFDQGTEHFLRRNSRFWVVRPQLSLRGATGLSTLISGAYIEIDPGPGAKQTHFVGLEEQPVIESDELGKKVVLMTRRLRSIDTGSPIYYQGLEAGEVLGHELANDRNSIYIHAFIKDPFHQLIRGNTRFWNVSGVDVSVGADGVQVQTESIRSIIYGGIAFDTPDTLEQASTDIDNLVFTLHDSFNSIAESEYTKKIKFIVFFDTSVRGLSPGAPVEFKGIRVGTVLDIRLEYDEDDTSFRIPVLLELEPQRIIERGSGTPEASYETLDKLVQGGLRARLQTGSLITSQLFIELDMHPDSPIILSGQETPYPELPTLASASMSTITQSAEDLLAKLNSIDVDAIASSALEAIQSADQTLDNANKLITTPGLEVAILNLESAMNSFKNVMQKVDDSSLQEAIDEGYRALEQLTDTLEKTSSVLEPDSPLQYNLIKLTGELEEMARSVRALVETVERNPRAFIFGKEQKGEQ